MQRVLLIDIENCQGHIDLLMADLAAFSKVVLCYAKTNVKIPMEWLTSLSYALQTGKLEQVRMPEVGKNAADFGLSFLAGRLSGQCEQPSEFVVLSDDKDLDYVVHLLQHYGHKASRQSGQQAAMPEVEEQGGKAQPPAPKEVNSKKTTAEQKQSIYQYCQHLLARHQAKTAPKTKAALLQSAKSIVQSNELAVKVVHYLISSSTVSVATKDQVSINVNKLTVLAHKAL